MVVKKTYKIEKPLRVKPHQGDPNYVTQEIAGQLNNYRQHILLFIKDMWGLEPQGVKPEYKALWDEVKLATGENWTLLRQTVSPEWFGDCVGEGKYGNKEWEWYDFTKGKNISWQQTLILLAYEKCINDNRLSRHITVRSGHGIGKSAVTTWIILWFLYCYFMSQVPVTAPTATQMKDVLWKELSIWIGRIKDDSVKEIFEWTSEYIRVKYDPEAWFARAKTASKENSEALAGVHGDNVLIAADEASAVPEQVFNTAEGALTSGNVFVMLISNPTRVIGYFYDSHHKNASDWQTFAFNCEESPLVNKEYVHRQAKRHGAHSDEYKIRVKGEFPSEDMMDDGGYLSLIPKNRILVVPSLGEEEDMFIGRKILAVDPSGEGDDECEFCIRDSFRAKIVHTIHTTNDKEIAEHLLTIATKYSIPGEDIIIEGFGKGADVAKQVAVATKGKVDIYVADPGNAPVYEEKINGDRFTRFEQEMDEGATDMFLNLRALGHFRMRNWLIQGGTIIDSDPEKSEFANQISINKYKRGLQGSKIQMMPKKEMNKNRIPSPNKSDALYLSFLLETDDGDTGQTKEEREAILHTATEVDDAFKVL